jgi:hypothetical protein
MIGALFVPRHRSEDRRHREDLHGRVKEPSSRGKEPQGEAARGRRNRCWILLRRRECGAKGIGAPRFFAAAHTSV